MELHGISLKKPLKSSPFSIMFEYRKDKAGFWGYNHMVVQLEDCADCLHILFPGIVNRRYKYLFNFELDHSSGHSKNRIDGFSCTKSHTNLEYGKKQSKMCATLIQSKEGFLGDVEEPGMLKVGNVQMMVFQSNDNPPMCSPDVPKEDMYVER
jgi:hypothetical protein